MPVRRDFTGYMYEVEDWEGSSFSGVPWKPLSPFCMAEGTKRCGGGGDWENKRGRGKVEQVLGGTEGGKQVIGTIKSAEANQEPQAARLQRKQIQRK